MTFRYAKLRRMRGFTLIELLIVMTIVGILAAIAVPSYKRNVIKARETVLMEDLYQMRRAIDSFYADKLKYPESLDELVDEKYLYAIPVDPFTNDRESWEVTPPESDAEGVVPPGSVFDVHSGSDLVGTDGRPYNEW